MKKKWLYIGVDMCLVAVVGVLAYISISQFEPADSPQDEVLGDPIIEIFDTDLPIAESPSQSTAENLRENSLKVIELINAERVKAGVKALTESELLYDAASLRATELEKLFSHNRPDGRLCFTVYQDFSITSRSRAENIAAGHKTPEIVVEAWMRSNGHNRNILNPDYKKIGVGVYQDTTGKLYWVQLFSD